MSATNANAGVGDTSVLKANCSRQKERALNSQTESATQAARKNESLQCPICERRFQRRDRQQRYCSTRCRVKAFREKTHPITGCTGSVTPPHKSSRKINELHAAKTVSRARIIGPRTVIQAEIIDGRAWEEMVSSSGVRAYVSVLARRALRDGSPP